MSIKSINSNVGNVGIEGYPDECPFCHKMIIPTFFHGYQNGLVLEVVHYCPNTECLKSFIGYYQRTSSSAGSYYYKFNGKTTVGNPIGKNFNDSVKSISNNFILIYNQAYAAEQLDLKEICGVGFRKALEFLIKDYLISIKPEDKENIEKKLLGTCIEQFVDDNKIKSVAKRATWLGNDETHYVRRWEGKNLEDLKKLIDMTVHWIEMELLTKSFESEMPG